MFAYSMPSGFKILSCQLPVAECSTIWVGVPR